MFSEDASAMIPMGRDELLTALILFPRTIYADDAPALRKYPEPVILSITHTSKVEKFYFVF